MTLVVSVSRPNFALLASDLRTLVRRADIAAPLRGAPVVDYFDVPKLTRFPGGFVAGSGFEDAGKRIRAALAAAGQRLGEAEIRAIVDREGAAIAAQLEAECPADAAHFREHQRLWAVFVGPGGPQQLALNFRGGDMFAEPLGYTVTSSGPAGLEPDELEPLVNRINGRVPMKSGVAWAVRNVAEFAVAVQQRLGAAGSVSEGIEFGVVRRSRTGRAVCSHYAARPASQWISWANSLTPGAAA